MAPLPPGPMTLFRRISYGRDPGLALRLPAGAVPQLFTRHEFDRVLGLIADWWSWESVELTDVRSNPYGYALRIIDAWRGRFRLAWNARYAGRRRMA